MPTININNNTVVVQTAAQWAADTTVYTNKQILITSDAFWGSTDQRKFKLADGVQTWSSLDYPPFKVATDALSEVLTAGNSTGGLDIVSPDGEQYVRITDAIAELYSNGGLNGAFAGVNAVDGQTLMEGGDNSNDGNVVVNTTHSRIQHTALINLDAPAVRLTQETASRIAILDASKDIVGADTATYPSLTELSYVKGVTSAIQTQLDSKVSDTTFFQTSNQSIADSTSYFIAAVTSPATSLALSSMIPVKGGTLIGVSLGGFNASTVGSNEAWTVKLWYNDGANSVTLTTNFTGGNANRNYYLDVDGLSTAISDGNCAIEFAAPALATNPTGFRPTATIYIKR